MFSRPLNVYKSGNYDLAEKLLITYIKKNKKDYKAYQLLGHIYNKKKLYKKSIINYNKSIKISNDKNILLDLGNLYLSLNNISQAILSYKKILQLDKRHELAINNLSYCYMLNYDYDKSKKYINKAISLNPKNEFFHFNFGNLYKRFGKLNLALASYDKAIKINPNNINFKYNKSYILLKKKLYNKAWHLYENRILAQYADTKIYNIVKENIYKADTIPKNKNIVIVPEQGIGDHILFSSMYKELIKLNPNSRIIVNKRLKNIFKRSFNFSNFINHQDFNKISYYVKKNYYFIYAGSLGKFFRKQLSDFNGEPFLVPNVKKIRKYKSILSKYNYKKFVGISWKSTAANVGEKSINLNDFKKILSNKDIGFINLQYGKNIDMKNFNLKNNNKIINIKKIDLYNEIDDVISIISCLDLVITTPNVNVHFAGSIGKKCLVLSPIYNELFLYSGLNQGRCEWYRNQKTFIINDNLKFISKKLVTLLRKI